MVDSREKGARAESAIKTVLKSATGLNWERVPSSGALNAKHGLKGDLYIPQADNVYCVEVKHYADDHLTSSILTSKSPQLLEWWTQAIEQAAKVGKRPLLIFKFDRSKNFVAFKEDTPNNCTDYMTVHVQGHNLVITRLDNWLANTEIKWTV